MTGALLLAALSFAAGGLVARSWYVPQAPGHGPLRSLADWIARQGLAALPHQAPQPRPCPREHLAVASFGQSNAANSVRPAYYGLPIPANLLQFDWRSGRCFTYSEPLIGADGSGGNVITYLAVDLVRRSGRP
ncbi:hypothetical protein [Synechococcus sp. GFB01]|uniref:hypothetical protein n=1 Tax=Synechococcus sp. GFB01 TaxID=1662190 RepID=UPI00128CD1B8|nr:hypothetical protein [Synechococcus sp. GFB01]